VLPQRNYFCPISWVVSGKGQGALKHKPLIVAVVADRMRDVSWRPDWLLWGVTPMSTKRIHALDGLRGLAALSVVVCHYVSAVFPHAVFGAQGAGNVEWQDALSRSPLVALYNGSFAVFIFFVLSGFVIARSAGANQTSLLILFGRRYLRLTVPMLCGTLLAYVLLKIFPDITRTAAQQFSNGWLAAQYGGRELTIFQATWDAVFNPYRFGEAYSNRVLWTMRIELFGSLVIYALYALVRPSLIPAVFVILFILTIPSAFFVGFMGFAGGALLYQAWSSGHLQPSRIGPVLVVFGFILGGLPMQSDYGTFFTPIVTAVATFSSNEFILGIAALFTVSGLLMWPTAQDMLQWRSFRFLGRVSFPLYLIHFPVLMTLFLFVDLKMGSAITAFVMLSIAYFLLVLLVAWVLTVLVDEPVVSSLQRAFRLPRLRAFYVVHGVLIVLLLSFVISRIGMDLGSLFVDFIGYAGMCVVLPLVVYNWTLRRGLLRPRSPQANTVGHRALTPWTHKSHGPVLCSSASSGRGNTLMNLSSISLRALSFRARALRLLQRR
jgi:peptidoglycan/LPS O-acetylase OafA/YrhL